MSDLFQIKKAPQSGTTRPKVRDRALEKSESDATQVRLQTRMVRAVELMDHLTTSDEALHHYLTVQASQAMPQVQPSLAQAAPLMQSSAKGQEAPTEEPDVVEELLQTPPPPISSTDFQQLKRTLMDQCRQTLSKEIAAQNSLMLLSHCALPGHCMHQISTRGEVIHHYVSGELNTDILRRAYAELHCDVGYIEVTPSVLTIVMKDGKTRKYVSI